MNRRQFLQAAALAAAAGSILSEAVTAIAPACLALVVLLGGTLPVLAQSNLVLRTRGAALTADSTRGVFLSLEDTASGVVLAPAPDQAESFRLVLLKPDRTTVTVRGTDQVLSSSRLDADSMTLVWDGPLRDTAGAAQAIAARLVITAVDGGFQFEFHLDNQASLKVQEAWYPVVGGLARFGAAGQSSDATLWVPTSTPTERPLVPLEGGAAFGYPGQMVMGFACLQSRAAGRTLYFGSHDPVARHKTFRWIETVSAGATNVAMCVQHSPFLPAGRSFDGSPVVLRFVEGDWAAAAEGYRRWFAGAFGIVQPKDDWIRQQSFFLMTMFMLPEGTINYTFKDIPRWAKSARDHGLRAVQISGWQRGGHDNGYPYYEPDPRLGTWAELEAGIRACHKLGLRVYFFANYQPMMVESDWYKAELHRYREMTASGGHTWMAGWGMGTLAARTGHPKLMTWANLAFPQFRRIIVDYFARLAQLGADGVHVDKMFPAGIDYNPESSLSPDTATWEGAIMLTKEIMSACRQANPAWCMSFECNWDRLLEFGGATWWVGNQLITRKVFPEHVETLGLYQAFDYLGVNNAVRDGHVVMVAPLNFSRALDWPPFHGLARYIREVKRIRDALADTVFFGDVLGQRQVTFGRGLPDGVAYTVFRNRETGRRTCILTNSRLEARTVSLQTFEAGAAGDARIRLHLPNRRTRTLSLPADLVIPGERVAFVEEGGTPR